jgi:hypothetical protein
LAEDKVYTFTLALRRLQYFAVPRIFLSLSTCQIANSYPARGFIASNYEHQCRSNLQIGTDKFLYKQPTQDLNGNWVDPTSPETGTHTVTNTGDWTVYGDGIPIWFQASDQVAFTASKTSSHSTPTNSNSPTSSSNRLSTGAKAGVGIAVALGVIAIAAIAGVLILRRRKRYQAAPTDGHELDTNNKPELHGQHRPVVHEIYSDDGTRNPIELGSDEVHDQRQ